MTDVSGASAAKSQCQENCNYTSVFLHLCGAWKPLASPPGKEICNTEVFPLLYPYPRGLSWFRQG